MIVPSMNSEELANEVLSDYDSVLRKVKYLIAALRREAIRSRNKKLFKIFDHKSKQMNNWLICLDYNMGDPLVMMVTHYLNKSGLNAVLVLSGKKTLVHYSSHFLERYNERFIKQERITKIELLKRFLPENNVTTFDLTTYSGDNNFEVFAKFKDGVGLGTSVQLNNCLMVNLKTYISTEMIMDFQKKEHESITKAYQKFWEEFLKTTGKDDFN